MGEQPGQAPRGVLAVEGGDRLSGCVTETAPLLGIIEQALETAGLMLGTDKSRGYCLEMICADFLAGANLGDQIRQHVWVFLAERLEESR